MRPRADSPDRPGREEFEAIARICPPAAACRQPSLRRTQLNRAYFERAYPGISPLQAWDVAYRMAALGDTITTMAPRLLDAADRVREDTAAAVRARRLRRRRG